jgi:hypothetical protein
MVVANDADAAMTRTDDRARTIFSRVVARRAVLAEERSVRIRQIREIRDSALFSLFA